MYKLVLLHDELMMFIKEEDEIDDTTKCIVYDSGIDNFSPWLLAGQWFRRVGPWEIPTQSQIDGSKGIAKLIPAES